MPVRPEPAPPHDPTVGATATATSPKIQSRSQEGTRSGLSNAWGVTLDLAALALLLRLAVVAYALAEPVWDGHYYALGARRIAAGLGYSEDLIVAAPDGGEQVVWFAWAHYPVGYSGLLALFYRILGTGNAVAPVMNAVTGALLAGVVHRVARHAFIDPERGRVAGARWGGEARATIAGLLVAIHPGLVLYSGAAMTEPLAALAMLLAILVVVADQRRWRGAIAGGVVLGLATLVRPNAILLAPFLALGPAFGRGASPKPGGHPSGTRLAPLAERLACGAGALVARTLVVGAFALATVAPWTLRNCRMMDACAFVSTNAGWNLVIGSAPGATGKFELLVGHTPAGAPECDEGGQVAQDRCWFRYGVATIRRDVARWLALIPAKLHHTMDVEWSPINYLREARPDLVSASAHVAWGRALTSVHLALVAVAGFGCAWLGAALSPLAARARGARRRGGRRAIAVATQVALVAGIVTLVIVGFDAFVAPSPFVWPIAVVACVVPLLSLPGSPPRSPALSGVAGVVLTTLATHAIFFGEDRYHLVVTPALAILAAGVGRRPYP